MHIGYFMLHSNLFFRQHLPSLLQASMRHSITSNPWLSTLIQCNG